MRGLIDRLKEITGIYGLGFDPASVLGIVLPLGFVMVVGGIGALLIWLLG